LKRVIYLILVIVGCLVVDAPSPINGKATTTQSKAIAAGVFRKGDCTMEIYLRTEDITEINVGVGKRILLESLRQAVVPPYVMIMPYYILPDFVRYVESRPLEEDGVHGTIFVLDAHAPGNGELTIGFKDMQSGEVSHQKVLSVTVSD
jgi:hypothetical protein